MTQLDLPAWSPPCSITPFPVARRIGKIRRTAELVAAKSGRDREAYWARMVGDLARQLSRTGIASDTIGRELQSFRDAVQRELSLRRGNAA